MTDTERVEASRQAWQQAAEKSFREQLATNTLTELEDIHAHLDRVAFPARFEVVREEMDKRLSDLEQTPAAPAEDLGAASLWRRAWGAFLDLFVMLLILAAGYYVVTGIAGIVASFGEQETTTVLTSPRRGPSPFAQFWAGLLEGEVAAWTNWDQWLILGKGVAAYLGVRALFLVPLWVRAGRTPGMRELGLHLQSVDGGRLTWTQAASRFVVLYVLGTLTLGVSALCSLWRSDCRALHDRLSGTKVVRLRQSWEKPRKLRLLD